MAMTLVYVTNRVDNTKIRKITNERGDEVWVVPSYTTPDNCVMNGGLYPADEIAKSYRTLEGTPAPLDHPVDGNGDYVSANSEHGVIYYQCGIFNKNVQRVNDPKYDHRIYVEKHIHIETAQKTERGRRVLEAIEKGEPIHTSTGVVLDPIDEAGEMNGNEYTWKATNMLFDHDCILLDHEGAATPDDGVGVFVNGNLIRQANMRGQTMTVNHVRLNLNESLNDLRQKLEQAIQAAYGSDDEWLYIEDFGTDYVVYSGHNSSYRIGYTQSDAGAIELNGEPAEVTRKTEWQAVSANSDNPTLIEQMKSALTQFFNNRGKTRTTNQEGNDMLLELIEAALTEAGIDFSEMSEDQKLAAYVDLQQSGAEEEQNQGGDKPRGESVANSDLQKVVTDAVAAAMAANRAESEKSDRDALAEQLKSNGSTISRETQDKMAVNELRELAYATRKRPSAVNFAGGQPSGSDDPLASYSKGDL